MKKIFETFKKWLGGLFKDETGTPSSKRFVGIICAITLCATLYHNSFSTLDIAPAPYLVDAVALLAFGCLGLSSLDKFTAIKKDSKTSEPQDPPQNTQNTQNTNQEIQICKVCGNYPCAC